MTPLASHLLIWGLVLGAGSAAALLGWALERLWPVEQPAAALAYPCALASDHRFYDSVCDRCAAVACAECRGEGAVYFDERDRREQGGRDCPSCAGAGVAA